MSDDSFLTAFASALGVGDQEVGQMEQGSQGNEAPDNNLSSPIKNQKKPSGCLTGTPSSAQRPLKIRQLTTSTPVKDTHTCRILLPPDISTLGPSNFESTMGVIGKPDVDLQNIELFSPNDAEKAFYSSVTVHVQSRFKGFQFKQAIPVMLGVVPGFKRSMSAAEIKAKDKILSGGLWSLQVNRCPDIPINEATKTQVLTRGFYGPKNRGVEEI